VFSRAAASYNRAGPRPFTHFARRIVDLAAVAPGSRVLDVATGTGAILLAAAERTGAEGFLVGVDLSDEMLARAHQEVRDRDLANVELRRMDAQQLDFDGASFDYAFCGFALTSLPDQADALAGIARVLRPGGRFGIVEAPSWFFLHDPRWARQAEVFRNFGVAVGDYEPGHERALLIEALRHAGFSDISATEEPYPLIFSDEEEWWAWMWSHGSRSLLEAVPDEKLVDLRQALAIELADCRDDEGTIRGKLAAHLLVAAKRPADELSIRRSG
jgi:O-methyltransferase / aklanonic acid methyltransferase